MSPHTAADSAAPPHGHHAAHQPEHTSASTAEPRRSWAVFALMIAAQFMVILDVSVVNVALPSISRSLDLSPAEYQWTVSAYVLLSGGLLLLGGRVADLLNRRGAFLAGVGLFTAASLTSGVAQTPLELVLSRAAQGAGAALLTPAALSIIMTAYAGRQRQTALAVWGTVGSLGIAAGVLFGGALTSALGWRAVFFINVPIGLAVVIGTLRAVDRGHAQQGVSRRLDLPGAVTLVGGLLALVWGIEATRTAGWTGARTWVSLAVAVVLLAAFARRERRAADPLVPPATWRIRSLVSASAVMAGVTGLVVGAIFLTSLHLQSVLGASPLVAGLEFLPLAAAITVAATAASKVIGTVGPRTLILAGLVVMAAGVLLLAAGAHGTSYAADVLPGLLLVGAGVGPMFVAISVAAMTDVPAEKSGLASGLMMTGHEIGAALGVAALTAVAGDLTSRVGLVDGYGRAFTAAAGVLAALFVLALVSVPRGTPAGAAQGGHGHGTATATATATATEALSATSRWFSRRERATSATNLEAHRTTTHTTYQFPGAHMLSSTPRTFVGSTTFTVTGMTCAHCQLAVTKEISAVSGVEAVSVDLASGTVTVTATKPVDRADIAAAVDEAGYVLVP